jgi:hypothetical protein
LAVEDALFAVDRDIHLDPAIDLREVELEPGGVVADPPVDVPAPEIVRGRRAHVHLLWTCADVSKLHPGAVLLPHFMPFTWCYPYVDVTSDVDATRRARPSGPGIRFCDQSTSLDTVFGAVFGVDSLPLA